MALNETVVAVEEALYILAYFKSNHNESSIKKTKETLGNSSVYVLDKQSSNIFKPLCILKSV